MGKLHYPLFSFALQKRLTAGLSHCNYTYGDLLFTQVCSDPAAMHCSTGQGQTAFPTAQYCYAKTGSQQAWVTATTPMEICCSHWCVVTQQQFTAALVRGKLHSSLFSSALQKRLTAGLGHCNYTYGDMLFIQVCGDARPMHCSTGQGKVVSLLFSAVLQSSLTACLCHCSYSYGDSLFIQVFSD